jgi:hypothetical protein
MNFLEIIPSMFWTHGRSLFNNGWIDALMGCMMAVLHKMLGQVCIMVSQYGHITWQCNEYTGMAIHSYIACPKNLKK